MNKMILRLGLLVLAAAALGVPAQALARDQVPFKGADAGTWGVGAHSCAAGLLPVVVDTSGEATHTGRYTYRSHECADLEAGTYAGAFTLTAANGDTIVGRYTGTFTADSDNIYYEQTNTIEGGSGNFAAATGSFHVSGVAALDGSWADVQQASGTISSIGSSDR